MNGVSSTSTSTLPLSTHVSLQPVSKYPRRQNMYWYCPSAFNPVPSLGSLQTESGIKVTYRNCSRTMSTASDSSRSFPSLPSLCTPRLSASARVAIFLVFKRTQSTTCGTRIQCLIYLHVLLPPIILELPASDCSHLKSGRTPPCA